MASGGAIPASIPGQTGGGFNPNFGAFDANGMNIGDLIPNSPIYMTADAQATAAYQNALAQINQNRQATLQQYGYMGTIDPHSGTISKLGTDPNNQYGEYQAMLNTHAANQETALANAAARGLGTGGLGAQGVTADHRSFGADSAQLGANLMNALMGFQSQQTQAQTTMDDTLWQAELAAAQQAILNQMYPTAPPGDGPPGPSGDPASPGGGWAVYQPPSASKPTSVFTGNTKTTDKRVRGGRI